MSEGSGNGSSDRLLQPALGSGLALAEVIGSLQVVVGRVSSRLSAICLAVVRFMFGSRLATELVDKVVGQAPLLEVAIQLVEQFQVAAGDVGTAAGFFRLDAEGMEALIDH